MKPFLTAVAALLVASSGCAKGDARVAAGMRAPSADARGLAPRVHFATASERVLARDRAAVDENAAWMRANPSAVVILEGHCDERGENEYNLELGDRRARGVMEILMSGGVDPDRLIVLSKGEGEPAVPGRGPAAWRENRRVEFIAR